MICAYHIIKELILNDTQILLFIGPCQLKPRHRSLAFVPNFTNLNKNADHHGPALWGLFISLFFLFFCPLPSKSWCRYCSWCLISSSSIASATIISDAMAGMPTISYLFSSEAEINIMAVLVQSTRTRQLFIFWSCSKTRIKYSHASFSHLVPPWIQKESHIFCGQVHDYLHCMFSTFGYTEGINWILQLMQVHPDMLSRICLNWSSHHRTNDADHTQQYAALVSKHMIVSEHYSAIQEPWICMGDVIRTFASHSFHLVLLWVQFCDVFLALPYLDSCISFSAVLSHL